MSALARNMQLDGHIREGIEYLPSFWSLVGLYQEMARTERKLERTILIERRAEAVRRKASPRRIAQLDEQIRRLK